MIKRKKPRKKIKLKRNSENMKKTKKFKKILLNKKRKNPKIDSAFLKHYLIEILVHGDPKTLSSLENYMAIGEYCNDCDRSYYNCACEGSREIPGCWCEDCDQKR
jgi:hypothetical protein